MLMSVLVGRERWAQAKRLGAVRTVHTVRQLGASPSKFAISKAQSRDRSAEGGVACALEIKTGLKRQATNGGANRPASNLQRIGRQLRVVHRARPFKLNGAGYRTVKIYTTLPARAFETGVVEHFANDKLTGLIGGHFARYGRWQRRQQANCHNNATQHARTPLTQVLYRLFAPSCRPNRL